MASKTVIRPIQVRSVLLTSLAFFKNFQKFCLKIHANFGTFSYQLTKECYPLFILTSAVLGQSLLIFALQY